MNKRNLSHLSTLILNTPLLCTPDYAETLCAVLGDRMSLDTLGMVAQTVDSSEKRVQGMSGDTAIIPIVGSMTHRATGIEAMSGVNSYASLQAQVEAAMEDSAVKSIALDWDSGGGQVAGAFDFRDYLMSVRGKKPIISIARDTMASAAYLLGSATDKIYLTQTGAVGSIGVVAMHVDQSEKNAKDGIKPTFIHAGAYKTAGNPHEALEGEALSYLQESVNDSYEMFINAVAEARGIDANAIRATEARMYKGGKAIKAGLADGVKTLDMTLTELAGNNPKVYQSIVPKGRPNSNQMNKESLMDPEEIATLQASADALVKELADVKASNETLRGYLIAEGYSITAEGATKAPADEYMEVEGEQVLKASIPASMLAAYEKLTLKAEDTRLTELASTELPHFAVDDAKALLAAVGSNEAIMTSLKSADAALGSFMEEKGNSGANGDMVSATDKLNALYTSTMEADGITLEAAKTKVSSSKEGMELFKLARKETK